MVMMTWFLGWPKDCQRWRERETGLCNQRERDKTKERESSVDEEEDDIFPSDLLSVFLMPKINVICLESLPLFCIFFPSFSSVFFCVFLLCPAFWPSCKVVGWSVTWWPAGGLSAAWWLVGTGLSGGVVAGRQRHHARIAVAALEEAQFQFGPSIYDCSNCTLNQI